MVQMMFEPTAVVVVMKECFVAVIVAVVDAVAPVAWIGPFSFPVEAVPSHTLCT